MIRDVRVCSRSTLSLSAALFITALAAGCGGGNDVNMGSTEDSSGGSVGGTSSGGTASGAAAGNDAVSNGGGDGAAPDEPAPGTPGGGPVSSVDPVSAGDECASERSDATLSQLDLFIMLDRSGSMDDPTAEGNSKWVEITGALDTFMSDPESASIGVGFGLFALYSGSARDEDDVLCEPDDYAEPVVGIAPLSTNASVISDAISDTEPLQYTPTRPALAGAVQYASGWATENPTHKVLVVLATDGLPNVCDSTVESVVDVARDGREGTPSILTYVIGVVGREDEDSVSNLNDFAEGGGTGTAFIVDPARDAGAEFLAAMNAIRAANRVDCDFAIPAPPTGKSIDFTSVSVDYTPSEGAAVQLPWVADDADCDDDGGWYYDDNASPSRTPLCEASCTTARADTSAKLSVLFGCTTGSTSGGGAGDGSGGSGAGGSSSGGSGSEDPACLLDGQSCQTADQCCSGQCLNGVCGIIA